MKTSKYRAVLAMALTGVTASLCSLPITASSAEKPAGGQQFDCPLWLKPDAFKTAHPPEGWTAVMPQAWRLDGGGMLHGAPDESAYLKPDDAKITKKGVRETGVTRWRLGPLPHSYETWLYCGYGPLQLFKRVPVNATECTATTETERGAFIGTVFICK
jgi:hypothetical protein